jgi:alpha-1,3-rhamnosyltransferase
VKLILFERNEAVTKRLNQGIAASNGDYISILYSDDYYLPAKLGRQMECFLKLPQDYGVVYSPGYRLNVVNGEQRFDPSLQVSGYILRELLLRHREGFVNPIAPLMRRECFEKYPYDETLFVEGESINLRFAMSCRFHYLNEPLVVMRERENNIGKAIEANVTRLMVVLDKLKLHKDFPKKYRKEVEIFRSRILRDSGWQGVRVIGDVQWARKCFGQSVKAYPAQIAHPRTVAGVGLSFLPAGSRKSLNRLANHILRPKGYKPSST